MMKLNLFWKKFYTNTPLDHMRRFENNWVFLGLQRGYTKFLCLWDSRARKEHRTRKDWPVCTELIPGYLNVLARPLSERSKNIFPPIHIKLGIM